MNMSDLLKAMASIVRAKVLRDTISMFRTLREVIDFYIDPKKFVPDAIGTDTTIAKGIVLNEKEIDQLEAFLRALTDPKPKF